MPTFTRGKDLLEWAEEEYLSELLLRAMKPKPGPRPPKGGTVEWEWGLVVGDAKLQTYTAKASGVTTWSLEGDWDKNGECELVEIGDASAGIRLVQKAPGTLSLECKRIAIARGPERRYTPPAKIDPTTLLVWGPREVTWTELLKWIAPPRGVLLFEQNAKGNVRVEAAKQRKAIEPPYIDTFRLQRNASDEDPWLWVEWMLTVSKTGHYFSVTRGTLDDRSWARVQRLPEHLGPCTVLSGGVQVPGKAWLEKIA
jgi:hypothetical protein